MENEIWKDVSWYKWLYEVSNLWNIKSLWNSQTKKEKILKPWKNLCWYLYVGLYKNSNKKHYLVHRLTAIAFLDNSENKKEVNHINWIKNDNRIENLEFCTRSENTIHNIKVLWNKTPFQTNNPMKWRFWKDNHLSKEINQYNLDWEFIRSWDWAREVQRELWIKYSSISNACLWISKVAWWFKWRMANKLYE